MTGRVKSIVEAACSNEGSRFALNGEQHVIQRLRPTNFKVAFDIVANQGDWLMAALAAWPECYVHAFEVAQPTFERLQAESGNPAAVRASHSRIWREPVAIRPEVPAVLHRTAPVILSFVADFMGVYPGHARLLLAAKGHGVNSQVV